MKKFTLLVFTFFTLFLSQLCLANARKGEKILEVGIDIGMAVGKALYNNYLKEKSIRQQQDALSASPVRRVPMSFSPRPVDVVVIDNQKPSTFNEKNKMILAAKNLGLFVKK